MVWRLLRISAVLPWLVGACSDGESDGGTSGAGGSAGSAASAGSGGSANSGNDASGGSNQGGLDSGPAGSGGASAGSGGTVSVELGSIGTGEVTCPSPAGTTCSAGQACCDTFASDNTCVSSLQDCSCLQNRSCVVRGCDEPADCPGAKCCAQFNPSHVAGTIFVATSCKPSCDPVHDDTVCLENADCPSVSDECGPSSQGFDRCF